MPTVREIEQALFDLAPKELAAGWDNVGQLLGDPDQQVSRILVALDITERVADEAISGKYDLIVGHHPVMNCKWLPVQSVRSDTPQGHLLMKLLLNRVPVICMHTNLDAAEGGVNDCLAEMLELVDPGPLGDAFGLGRVGTLKQEMSLQDFAAFVCKALDANGVRYAGANKPVRRVAVGGGSCSDLEETVIAAGCDTFVTSDISYHQFLDAEGKGINLIDAGHFPTENPVCQKIVSFLSAQFPELIVEKALSHKEIIQYCVNNN